MAAREIQDPAPTQAEQDARLERWRGQFRTGTVLLRDFDKGVVETLRASVRDELPAPDNQRYWLDVSGVDAPPGMPGVPVTFSFPEAEFKSYTLPLVLIRRDDIAPAMSRWHPNHQTYRCPVPGAVSYRVPTTYPASVAGKTGWDRMEVGYQDIPYDLTYTISVLAHYRGADGQRGNVQAVLEHVLRIYQPQSLTHVVDSLGDPRSYFTWLEAISVLDSSTEVADRTIGFGVTIKIEAELSHTSPRVVQTVRTPLTLDLKPL